MHTVAVLLCLAVVGSPCDHHACLLECLVFHGCLSCHVMLGLVAFSCSVQKEAIVEEGKGRGVRDRKGKQRTRRSLSSCFAGWFTPRMQRSLQLAARVTPEALEPLRYGQCLSNP